MSFCKHCASAAITVWHGMTAGCKGCAARSAGRSPEYSKAAKGDENAAYKALLKKLNLKHSEVEAARAADALTAKKGAA